jgi:glycosyltransferase involved in cell wall biosynthesis
MTGSSTASREKISVLYPTCGRPDFLVRSISALLQGDVLPDEIVVVDQSRSAETGQALSALGDDRIVHVPSNEKGLSRARNLGIRSSRHPILGSLDDDCIPARNWIRRASELIAARPESGIWIGTVVFDERELEEAPVEKTATLAGVRDPWRYDPTGGASFFRRTVFDQVGPFDPLLGQGSRFPGAEDGDLLYRVLKHGIPVTFSNRLRCYHIRWRSDVEKLDNRYNYGCGVGAMLAKYTRRGDLTAMAYIFVRHFLKKFLLVPYHGALGPKHEYRRNLTYCRGMIEGFLGWRRMQAAARAGSTPGSADGTD